MTPVAGSGRRFVTCGSAPDLGAAGRIPSVVPAEFSP
jgi:hypothetical protein